MGFWVIGQPAIILSATVRFPTVLLFPVKLYSGDTETLPSMLALCEGNVRGVCRLLSDSPHKGPVMQGFCVFFVVIPNRLLNKHSSYWWFETSWRSCDVTVMLSSHSFKRADIHQWFTFRVLVVVPPESSDLFLSTDVPHSEGQALAGRHRLHVEADRRDCCHLLV